MEGQKTILMCASCWRIQPLVEDLGAELDQWLEPTTFMSWGQWGQGLYDIVDGYCDPCLMEMALRDQLALARAAEERTNA
jgi:hypothetical protein